MKRINWQLIALRFLCKVVNQPIHIKHLGEYRCMYCGESIGKHRAAKK